MQISKLKNSFNGSGALPSFCPDCDSKLKHVNAIDTKARTYFIYCPNSGCKWCREFKVCPSCGEWICL